MRFRNCIRCFIICFMLHGPSRTSTHYYLKMLWQAVSTWTAADGIEQCRRGCGGHGFSALSGLPNLFASYVQNVTWEGDNNVLCLQVRPSFPSFYGWIAQVHVVLLLPSED